MVSVVPLVPVHRIVGNHVRLDVFGVSGHLIPAACALMAAGPVLARQTGATFTKFLGTGHGKKFTAQDADLNHWAVLTTWPSAVDAASFDQSPVFGRWRRISYEHRQVLMRPATSVGSWSGVEPFVPHPGLTLTSGPNARGTCDTAADSGASDSASASAATSPMVASITRARVKLSQWRHFQRSVPPVAEALTSSAGLVWAVGIGESPIGWQGTFSVWESIQQLRDFAYGGHAHREVITRTKTSQWYAEELFATFAVDHVVGNYKGQEFTCR